MMGFRLRPVGYAVTSWGRGKEPIQQKVFPSSQSLPYQPLQYGGKQGGYAVYQFAEFGDMLQAVAGQFAGSGEFFVELSLHIGNKVGFFKNYIQLKVQIKAAAVAVAGAHKSPFPIHQQGFGVGDNSVISTANSIASS